MGIAHSELPAEVGRSFSRPCVSGDEVEPRPKMSPEFPSHDLGSSGKNDDDTTPEVLVVEDESAVGEMLELALRRFGFRVRLAGSGRQALEVYRRHANTIDVILLDVQMPELDGPATLAALRHLNLSAPVVFMSGDTGRYAEEDLLAWGAARVLQKPFWLDQLGQALWQLARRHPRPSS
jgi:CheY-like chemotaxis protein